MKQAHEGKAKQVSRQRLLHLHRRGTQRLGHAGKSRQVGVNRKRPQHAQKRQQHGQRPARCAPELLCVRVHRQQTALAR